MTTGRALSITDELKTQLTINLIARLTASCSLVTNISPIVVAPAQMRKNAKLYRRDRSTRYAASRRPGAWPSTPYSRSRDVRWSERSNCVCRIVGSQSTMPDEANWRKNQRPQSRSVVGLYALSNSGWKA